MSETPLDPTQPDAIGDLRPQRLVAPREVRREHHGGTLRVDETRGADAHRAHLRPGLGPGPELRDELRDRVLDRVGVGGRGVAPAPAQDPPGGVDEPGGDLRAADVDPDRRPHATPSMMSIS